MSWDRDPDEVRWEREEAAAAEREELAKKLGREPTDEEFEDAHDAWVNAEMEAYRPEYERIKRWAEPEPDEAEEQACPKLLYRRLAGLS